jgi:hypothetical protein
MGYQTGTIGPISFYQDNSGDSNDMDTTVTYTPEMYGAPPGAQIMTASVQVSPYVIRGKAYVHNESVSADSVQFEVYTQAANDGWFGWHSGSIVVTTTFQWWSITDSAVAGGQALFTQEPPAVLPSVAA